MPPGILQEVPVNSGIYSIFNKLNKSFTRPSREFSDCTKCLLDSIYSSTSRIMTPENPGSSPIVHTSTSSLHSKSC